MKIVTVAQMQAIEKQADASGLSYMQMMQNAGRGLAELVGRSVPAGAPKQILGLVGSGNNGGDTLIALAHLARRGWHVCAYVVDAERKQNDNLINDLRDAGGEVTRAEHDPQSSILITLLEETGVLLDGLLGTGIRLPLKQGAASVLACAQNVLRGMSHPPYVIAVDCPSGVDCDTGVAAPETIHADLTAVMAALKRGLLDQPAFEYAGHLALVEIGLPSALSSFEELKIRAADFQLVKRLLPKRALDSNKGTFGSALLAVGSLNYTGAALLAGTAAYRVGAGLVTLAVPEPLHAALAAHLPEATWILLPHEAGFISGRAADGFINQLGRATALLIGPGLGAHVPTRTFIENILSKTTLPMVIDADGLRHLAQIEDWHKKLSPLSILTPHPGEMSALTGLSIQEVQRDRTNVALQYAKEWGHIVVLKGACTVIASPDQAATIIPVASPALARAGTGDVLAGAIVGLRAQRIDPYDAAVAGAYIHAQAGLHAARRIGNTASVLAGDVLTSIADVLSNFELLPAKIRAE